MDIAPLYNDCEFLADWPGVPVGNEEGELISGSLGDKKAILLAHHGHLVAGAGIEESCSLAMLIERAAELQLAAMAAGTIVDLPLDWAARPTTGRCGPSAARPTSPITRGGRCAITVTF